MSGDEVARLAVSIRSLLSDPQATLRPETRHRWEGALAVLEAVMGEHPSLLTGADNPDLL